ncbi:MAG TPA: DUF5611 family protein [Thermoplasmata archaeon]|nr:DUF5611 family protein [Thermoplasmata archaeon]
MQTYPVRTSHRKNLELAAIGAIARQHFAAVEVGASEVVASSGAIERLAVRPDGRGLSVDVRTNPRVDEAVARETIAHYNRFLEEVTGYSAKERAKRLRKSAGE